LPTFFLFASSEPRRRESLVWRDGVVSERCGELLVWVVFFGAGQVLERQA
jgi:hypothetical protein